MPSRIGFLAAIVVLVLAASPAGECFALSESNVLVLYNASSPDGQAIADYYAQVHPGVTTLAITDVPAAEEVSYDVYLNQIRPQVLGALTPDTQCIVTTKGLPLRLSNPKPSPYSYAWKSYSSLESELTRIDTINTRDLMGNQDWQHAAPTGNPLASNPYYYANASFSTQAYGTRLTSRLDGYTVADVEGAIDRAQKAVLRPGYTFVLDDDPTAPAAAIDRMPELAANVLAPRSIDYTYDNTDTFVTNTSAGAMREVLGYVSHGVYGGGARATTADSRSYIQTQLAFKPAPGAVFSSWESYNAYSFTPGVNKAGLGEVAEWLHVGGTAGVGNVEEPCVDMANVTNEDRLWSMLLAGYTFGEAAWNATRQLSYVNTVVGDPLMVLKPWVPGDVDLDGGVGLGDLAAVKAAYGSKVGEDRYDFFADMNLDGCVNLSDLAFVKARYGNHDSVMLPRADSLSLLVNEVPATMWDIDSPEFIATLPEPATLSLLALGALALGRRRKRQ
jgi:uncharacterized protein (TIGR03790 family)